MKFSIGDKVLMKQTGEEGVVTAYLSKEILEVDVNGVVFPVYLDEVDHPYLKWFTENSKKKQSPTAQPEIPTEQIKTRQQRLPRGIYLSFFPQFIKQSQEDVVESLKVFLVNELPMPVRFAYKIKLQQGTHFAHDGTLHPFANLYLHEIDFEVMNDNPKFIWTMADASNPKMKIEEGITKIRPDKLFGHINQLLLNNEPAFSYKLLDDFMLAPKPVAVKIEKPKPASVMHDFTSISKVNISNNFSSHYIIDLHIQKLMPDVKGLSNSAIMEIQLSALSRSLQNAIVSRQEKMIVIHGIGTGVLKDAVHKVLAEMPEVLRFANEWLGGFGFGATEVVFKR